MKKQKIKLYDYVWTKEDTVEKAIPPRPLPKHTGGYLVDFVTGFRGEKGCLIDLGEDCEGFPVVGLDLDQIELVYTADEDHAFFVLDHPEYQTYEKIKELYKKNADEVWRIFQDFKERGITYEDVMSGKIKLH